MADQDQTFEKKPEGSEVEGLNLNSIESGIIGSREDLDKGRGLDEISSPDKDQERKKELMEKIQRKGKSVNNDDDSSADDDDHKEVKAHAKDISEIKDIEQQIEKLVKLAVQKDPYTAIKVARDLDENYVLDQVHDKLIEDETKKVLFKKGLLKEL